MTPTNLAMTTIFSPKNEHGQLSKRRPRLHRAAEDGLPPFRLTARDRAILEWVYSARMMTAAQLEALLFRTEGKTSGRTRINDRLAPLFHHGYLYRRALPGTPESRNRPFVYMLDRRGAEYLADQWDCDLDALDWAPEHNHVKDLFVLHFLETVDVRVSLTLSAQRHGCTVEEWLDEPTLRKRHQPDVVTVRGSQGGTRRVSVIPDAYCLIDPGGEDVHHCFIELDRGSEPGVRTDDGQRSWRQKVQAINAYVESGKYYERYNAHGLKVLCVTTTDRRAENLKRVTEAAGGRTRFWVTTLTRLRVGDFLTDPLWRLATRDGLHSFLT